MKKCISIFSIILIVLVTLSNMNIKTKGSPLTELMLKNIECLATPENPNVNCYLRGTVDCPKNNTQVLLYF